MQQISSWSPGALLWPPAHTPRQPLNQRECEVYWWLQPAGRSLHGTFLLGMQPPRAPFVLCVRCPEPGHQMLSCPVTLLSCGSLSLQHPAPALSQVPNVGCPTTCPGRGGISGTRQHYLSKLTEGLPPWVRGHTGTEQAGEEPGQELQPG